MNGGFLLLIPLLVGTVVANSDAEEVKKPLATPELPAGTPPEKVETVTQEPELKLRVLDVGEASLGHAQAHILLSPTYLPVINLVTLLRVFIDEARHYLLDPTHILREDPTMTGSLLKTDQKISTLYVF